MEHDDENQETPCFVPVIARLDRLDRVIELLEEKRRCSKSDACAVDSKNGCKTLSLALEEVHHKGTLMERLTLLEKRALELSLEVDQGNTMSMSRSSSSTVQSREIISKDCSELRSKDENGDAINKQQMQDPSTIQAQENAAEERNRSRRQKTKSQKRRSWLFRHTC